MKNAKNLPLLFAAIAAVLIVATVIGYAGFQHHPAMILTSLQGADARSETLMEAICSKDYAAAGESLQGKPALQWDQETATQLSTQLWTAYADSVSYEFSGPCYATASGIFRDVTVTALDVPALGPKIQERFSQLLKPYLLVSRYDSEINDENGNLRPEFTAKLLQQAVEQTLQQDSASTEYRITLELVFQNGRWWVVPAQPVIDLIAGAMTQ